MNLYLIRGLPGSGKSTLAKAMSKALGCIMWEADQYHMEDGVYNWKHGSVPAAHLWCRESVVECMQLRHSNIIVSNTFTTEKELKPYLELAEGYGYTVTTMIIENRHGNASIHGVPEETMAKMKARFSVKL